MRRGIGTLIHVGRVAVSLAAIAGVTLLNYRVLGVNSTTAALVFLIAILGIATAWGLAEAGAASILAVLCLNYFFFPPMGTLTIADPENWIALIAFLLTAVVASQLSASAKQRAAEATRRQHEMEKLYALSRRLLLETGAGAPGQIAYHVAQVFEAPGVALFDRSADRVYQGGAVELPIAGSRLRDAAIQGTAAHDEASGVELIPVTLGGAAIGTLAVSAGSVSDTALHSIANLAAITLERSRTQEITNRADAARENEELKSTLLDAIAHEFKTPLTSIKAAVSALALVGDAPGKELLTIVEEEADRLDALVTEAIQMARIEAGQVRIDRHPRQVREIVDAALGRTRIVQDRDVRLDIPTDSPPVFADRELVALVIRQLIDNSIKYAGPDSPIEISARERSDSVVITIADRGPGIPEQDQARIFERFYRGPASSTRVPGTGMGLAIAREIVEAHGGTIAVRNRTGGGSEFEFTLPFVPSGALQ